MTPKTDPETATKDEASTAADDKKASKKPMPKEIGGQKGPEPTRYGDWEKNGIISDF